MTALTQQRLREILDYNAETGVFVWRVSLSNAGAAGTVAGGLYKNGRRYIAIDKKRHFASRLAWLYVHGVWPSHQLDHRNGVRDDNSIGNLREATNGQNAANRGALRTNLLGVKGVGAVARATTPPRYRARIRVNDRLIHLGYFSSPEAANRAYAEAAVAHFGEFARSA